MDTLVHIRTQGRDKTVFFTGKPSPKKTRRKKRTDLQITNPWLTPSSSPLANIDRLKGFKRREPKYQCPLMLAFKVILRSESNSDHLVQSSTLYNILHIFLLVSAVEILRHVTFQLTGSFTRILVLL